MPTDVQLLTGSLTPWRMFLTADIVVQVVMLILLLASVLTWTILIVKCLEMIAVRRRLAAGLRAANSQGLAELRRQAGPPVAAAFADAALAEMDASGDLPAEGVKDRIALVLRRLEGGLLRRLAYGTGILASIGSCAPFIGLFGTVWGIMNSFIGISQSHTTNLAVVAPGIAEALLATACGLVAAVPAVLTYNLLARLLAAYRAGLSDLSALVLVRASREVDLNRFGRVVAARPTSAFPRAVVE